MARYFTRSRSVAPKCAPEGEYDDPLLPSVYVSDHEATDTGLVDLRGDPIMRAPNPMGFVWRD